MSGCWKCVDKKCENCGHSGDSIWRAGHNAGHHSARRWVWFWMERARLFPDTPVEKMFEALDDALETEERMRTEIDGLYNSYERTQIPREKHDQIVVPWILQHPPGQANPRLDPGAGNGDREQNQWEGCLIANWGTDGEDK